MAYDKLCDSAALDAGLEQIADAIREKGGTTDSLSFPAGMAEAIGAISAGGGDLLGRPFKSGSFTLAEDMTSDYDIADISEYETSGEYNTISLLFREYSAKSEEENYSALTGGIRVATKCDGSHVAHSAAVGYSSTGGSNATKNSGVHAYGGILKARFTSSFKGMAGETYNWLIMPMEVE